MAERIEMTFGVWTQIVQGSMSCNGVHIGATGRIRLNCVWRQCGLFVKLLWPLVIFKQKQNTHLTASIPGHLGKPEPLR